MNHWNSGPSGDGSRAVPMIGFGLLAFNISFASNAVVQARDAATKSARIFPRGAQVTITTSDAGSLQAIRQFMTAQRGDHRADGHDDEMQVARFLIGTWNCAPTVADFSGTYTTSYSPTLGNRWIKQTCGFPFNASE